MQLNQQTILVTGSTGFIGGRLAERLVQEEGARVRALVRNMNKADGLAAIGVEPVQGDVNDPESLQRAVKGCQLVVHCAAVVHDFQATPEQVWRVNVIGTVNVFKAAAEAGVARFLHLSSIGVYGISPRKGTEETDPLRFCGDPYCDSKIEAERVVVALAEETRLPVVIIRPANVYGPRSPFWTLGLFSMIKAGKLQLIDYGNGMSNHVYIDNLADAVLLALRDDGVAGEAFIVSDGVDTPWKVFLAYYTRMLGREPLPSISKPRAWLRALMLEGASLLTGKPPALSRRAVGFWTQKGTYVITKARKTLGYNPRITLDEGMKRNEVWLREAGHLN